MNRRVRSAILAVLCAGALVLLMWAAAIAQEGDTTTTTASGETTTTTGGEGTTTTSGEGTTTSSTSSTTSTVPLVAISSPVEGAVPTFVSTANSCLAWTGLVPGGYSTMYLLDLRTMTNNKIGAGIAGHYYNPCADGPWVVFQGGRAGAYEDIYVYDTGNGLVNQITHNSDPGDGNDWNPRIDDGRIVWEKHASGSGSVSGIYLLDLRRGGKATLLLAGDSYHNPDISGNYVVCAKESPEGSDIVLYDLTAETTRLIGIAGKNNERPRIDSGLVVWSAGDTPSGSWYPWTTYQVVVYNIAAGTTRTLTDNKAGNFNPSICGSVIAWEQRDPAAIVVYDLSRDESRVVVVQGDTPKSPDLDDSIVAFVGAEKLYYFRIPWLEMLPFPDVLPNSPYGTAIRVMAMYRIIQGYEDGRFGLGDPITRQQFAKMIVLTMAEWRPEVFTPTFTDKFTFADADAIERKTDDLYPYYYVAKAALTGLVRGYADGTFRPLANISRQQVISMIVRGGREVLSTPPKNWQGVLGYANKAHGENIRIAEYNGLLEGIQGPRGTLGGWDTTALASRGEVAQMLYNLLQRLLAAK